MAPRLPALGNTTRLRAIAPPEVVIEKLKAASDAPMPLSGDKPVIARLGRHGGTLVKRLKYQNSFQTVLRLRVQDDEETGGSRIRCKGGPAIFAVIFVIFFLAVVAAIFTFGFGDELSRPQAGNAFLVSIPAFMVLVALTIVIGGRWMARDEEAFLIDFVCRATGAGRVDRNDPSAAESIVR